MSHHMHDAYFYDAVKFAIVVVPTASLHTREHRVHKHNRLYIAIIKYTPVLQSFCKSWEHASSRVPR